MPRRAGIVLCTILTVSLISPAVLADSDQPLGSLLLNLFSPQDPLMLDDSVGHDAHFASQPAALDQLGALNRGIASQLSTFPLGSSSGGFTYSFDPTLGVYNRSTESFGPLFAERAVTAGKGKVNFGVTYQRSAYDSFDGLDLQSGAFNINLLHEDTNNDGTNINIFFEGDIINAAYRINLTSETAVLFGNYGVSDRLDVGLAVPFVKLDMNVRVRAQIDRFATGAFGGLFHRFDPNNVSSCPKNVCGTVAFFDESASASGVGDVVVRAKYKLTSGSSGALAAGVDLRLPTGDQRELLGSGATQTKLYIIASSPSSKFSPHANLGYTFSAGASDEVGDIPNEINYVFGFDAALGSHVTINADVIGRTLLNANSIRRTDKEFFFNTSTDPNNPIIDSKFQDEFVTENTDLNLMLAAAGIKVNIVSDLLFNANVLFGIGNRGLQADITPVFGLDYTF